MPSPLAVEYVVEQRALVETSNDSGTFTDTTSLKAEVSLRRTSDGGSAGLVQSVLLAVPGTPESSLAGISLPVAFSIPPIMRGVVSSPSLRISPAPDPCRTPADVPVGIVRDLVVYLPDLVSAGTSWTDSSSYRTCRAGALLTVSTRRTFRVREFSPGPDYGSLAIERSTRTTLRGFASRGEDTTVVEGSGTGRMTFTVHASTGSILSADGTSSLDITVRAKSRTERARQSLEARIRRRAP